MVRRSPAALVVLPLILTATVGCGGASPSAPQEATGAHIAPARPARTLATGPAIFAAACVVCHSLSGRAAPSQQGGDLRGYRLSRSALESFTRGMPVGAHPPLTAAEVRTVADYLFTVEQRAAVH